MNQTYPMRYQPTHHRASSGMVYEHILIAERLLKRPLEPEEVIHHQDGIRTNNTDANIIVFRTNADHSRYHRSKIMFKTNNGTYISPKRELKYCIICSKVCKNKYCSYSCANLGGRKVIRPTRDHLLTLMKSHTFIQISKIYNVSDRTIANWAKDQGLPTKRANFISIIS